MARLPALLVLLALACTAATDRDLYAPGDEGTASFRGTTGHTLWLSGCSVYTFEQLTGGDWRDAGPPFWCIWEGFAVRVEPGESHVAALVAPQVPGTWRLRYPVGHGCQEDQPMNERFCERLLSTATAPFTVAALCPEAACGPQLGMPNVLCSDGSIGGPTGRCLRDPDTGVCGWEIAECPDPDAP